MSAPNKGKLGTFSTLSIGIGGMVGGGIFAVTGSFVGTHVARQPSICNEQALSSFARVSAGIRDGY